MRREPPEARSGDNPFGWGAPGGGATTPEALRQRDTARSSTSEVRGPSQRRDPGAREDRRRRRRFVTVLGRITAVLALAAIVVAAVWNPFAPDAQVQSTAVPVTTGPLGAGTVAAGQLAAGQCFTSYASAWQDEFTLVDCTQPHAAELYAITQATVVANETVYPGEDRMADEAMRACQAAGVLPHEAAASIPDLRVEAAFALTQAEWDAGVRSYWCFASRAGGAPLESSLTIT